MSDVTFSIDFYDSQSGQLLATSPAVSQAVNPLDVTVNHSDGSTGTFVGTGSVDTSHLGALYLCSSLNFSADMKAISGLDEYPVSGSGGSNSVPAYMTLADGRVHDLLTPPTTKTNGFDAPTTTTWDSVTFDANDPDAMWAQGPFSVTSGETSGNSDSSDAPVLKLTLGGETIGRYDQDSAVAKCRGTLYNTTNDCGQPRTPTLPQTNLNVSNPVFSTNAASAAFTASDSDSVYLYTVPAAGGEPTKIATLGPVSQQIGVGDTYEVVRFQAN